MLEKLREKNPSLDILPVEAPEFGVYGMVHEGVAVPQMKAFVQAHGTQDAEELYIPCEDKLMEMEKEPNLIGDIWNNLKRERITDYVEKFEMQDRNSE